MRIKHDDYYSTSDLALAAVISLSFPLEEIDRIDNSRKALFLFKRVKQLDQLIESYWKGEVAVNPQIYFNALKNIKARIYEQG